MPSKEASSPASNSGGSSSSCGLTGPPEAVCSGTFSESCFIAEVGGALALVTTAAAMAG